MNNATLNSIALAGVLVASLAACSITTSVSPAEEHETLVTELSSSSVLAKAPMQDSARVAGSVVGQVAVIGLLNQTAPCFTLGATASRTASRVTIRVIATEQPGTCATFAAGAFDYDVGVRGLAPGTYDVEVIHRVVLKDGHASEMTLAERRAEVR